MIVSIFPYLNNDGVKEITCQLIEKFFSLNVTVYLSNNLKTEFDNSNIIFDDNKTMLQVCDFAVAVGGDGTTLNVAKNASLFNKATLGVNAGRLGFMSGIERNELDLIDEIVNENYQIDQRMMIQADVIDDNKVISTYHCLNDAVISRGDLARLIDIKVKSDGRNVTKTRADGIIVSTPTGSTAYSMAAGGPVLSPDNSCFVVTPICPHSLINRSIVISSEKQLYVEVENDKNNNSYLSIDGEVSIKMDTNSQIKISKSPYTAKLIKVKPDNFYEILDKKLIERRN